MILPKRGGPVDREARANLRMMLEPEVVQEKIEQLQAKEDKAPSQWKWKGLNVYLVDAMVLRAPDTIANQKMYPQPTSQKEGLGFPQIRVLVTTSLATKCITQYNSAPVIGKQTGSVKRSMTRPLRSRSPASTQHVSPENHGTHFLTRSNTASSDTESVVAMK